MVSVLFLVAIAAPTIEVSVSPKGSADVHVEATWGVVAGKTGTPIEVKPGIAVVRVTRSGYWDGWATVKIPKKGNRKFTIKQKPGVPLDEYSLTGQVFFSKSATWQRNQTTPWKVSGKEIILSGQLPGSTASGSIQVPVTNNYVLECQIYVSGQISSTRVFGQTLPKAKGWRSVRIIGLGNKEYLSLNSAKPKAAKVVNTGFTATYPKGGKGEVRIRRVVWKQLGDTSAKYLRRIYGL
jgi:hypothetical protein